MAYSSNAAPVEDGALEPLLAGYRRLQTHQFDEMLDANGHVRGHWQTFLRMLTTLGPEEVERRFSVADRHLRDSGVFYRVYEDPAGLTRPWPLSHVPLIIDSQEWQTLKAGLIQRAELLEAVLDDLYGPNDLVRDARLPAAVVTGNPEFLRPLVGVEPVGGFHLRFYGADIGRSPDGRWWVLGDRTQAPSGAGYALENRIALSRAMPDIYRALRVERVAPFFQALQLDLSSLARHDGSRVCVLTPGPLNETYFEHAYLARYLGFLLVEGEDLVVRDDGVFIRTVSGLKRADVLLRRLDADFADPLELDVRSRLGVPGLTQAVRDGTVAIVNSLGSGVMESPAMLSFLPALAQSILGRDLLLPNIATWWLGDAAARSEALSRFNELLIAPAFAGQSSAHMARPAVPGRDLDAQARADLIAEVERRGVDFVAQEAVALSTTPVWENGGLEPRPFVMRIMLARTRDGWQVMPGGFVRIADDPDARVVKLQHGGRTSDAWILSNAPVEEITLLPAPDHTVINRTTGALPSRAAANLFWLGRYAQRVEATLRLVRAMLNRSAEAGGSLAGLNERIVAMLAAWEALPEGMLNSRPALAAAAAILGDLNGSLSTVARNALAAASVIRDRFSPDAWRALTELTNVIAVPFQNVPDEGLLLDRVNEALRIVASFSGLAQENMSQLYGWRFLELGLRAERALTTCRFIRQFAFGADIESALDCLLELADSQITYRLRYVMVAARVPVVDLVALDPDNPRSIIYQLARIETHLGVLPKRLDESRLSPAQQIVTMLCTRLRTTPAEKIDSMMLGEIESELMKLSDVTSAQYFIPNERSEAAESLE